MKAYQANILFQVFENGLRCYLRFLIGFSNRSEKIKKSQIVNTIRETTSIRLNQTDPNEINKIGDFVNDLDLI